MGAELPLSSTERSRRRRAALRAQGLKPRTFWLPDRSSPAYLEQVRRDCQVIRQMRERSPDVYDFAESHAAEALASIPPWDDED